MMMDQEQEGIEQPGSLQFKVQDGSYFKNTLNSQGLDPSLKTKIENAIKNAKPRFGTVVTDKMIADELSKSGLSGREILDLANAGGRKEPKPVPQLKPGSGEMTGDTSVLGAK